MSSAQTIKTDSPFFFFFEVPPAKDSTIIGLMALFLAKETKNLGLVGTETRKMSQRKTGKTKEFFTFPT
jgi:hypothetical protein